jgi:hypothetical protein
MRKKKSGKPTRKKELTEKESRLVKAFLNGAKTRGEAAIEAGYSPKNPSASANQALESIRMKAPEAMDKLGLTVEHLIKNHLNPLLKAQETKIFVFEDEHAKKGKHTKRVLRVNLADNTTRRYATRMAFELQGAFPPQDPQLAAQVGVEVIVLDVARPDRSAINVTPTNGAKPAKQKAASDNGAKPDPRPEQ